MHRTRPPRPRVVHSPSPPPTQAVVQSDISVQNSALLVGWTRARFEQLTSYSQAFTEAVADTLGVPLTDVLMIELSDAADGSGLRVQFACSHISSQQKAHSLAALMSAAPYKHFLAAELKHDGLPVLGNLLLGTPRVLSAMGSHNDDSDDDDDGGGTHFASQTGSTRTKDNAAGVHDLVSKSKSTSGETKGSTSIHVLLVSIVSGISR